MSEQVTEVQKLATIAGDISLSAELRIKAIELLGRIGNNEAFRALLDVVGNEELIRQERELALKQVSEILKSIH
jgi:HEAT repeat protein